MSSLREFLEVPSNEREFIRRALGSELRLDGRQLLESREIKISLSRGECSSYSEVQFGTTRVSCTVIGEIVKPYADRPTEGMIQINAEMSIGSDKYGVSRVELSRMLERSIRDSDALDTESLCVVSGEKVWSIRCDANVLDHDGNIIDAASLATMAALRAFRKPEVSLSVLSSESTSHAITEMKMFTADEREPLPLALHHTPLCVTLAIFKNIPVKSDESIVVNDVLVLDPTGREELAMDGHFMLSINAHREVCAVLKPGGVGVTSSLLIQGAGLAATRAIALHSQLSASLVQLEEAMDVMRRDRLKLLQSLRSESMQGLGDSFGEALQIGGERLVDYGSSSSASDFGIHRDDPMLAWTSLHQAAAVREVEPGSGK